MGDMVSQADRIKLTGIHAWGYHGVLDSERVTGQEFWVDIELETDTSDAALSDDLARTVDYSEIAVQAHAAIAGTPVALIETLAQRIAAVCLSHTRVSAVTVTVNKPQAPITVPFENVSVTIHRVRADA